jgi:hypothetical protein
MARLEDFVSRQRDARAEVLRFPPVMSRRQLERSGYLKSFPNLLGCVCALHGSEAAIRSAADRYESGGDWTTSLGASDLVLSPPPAIRFIRWSRPAGRIPAGGLIFDVGGGLLPPRALALTRSAPVFRMREFVRIGQPEEITAFREAWMTRARQLAEELALPYSIDVANDPFFGRVGQIMAVSQIQQALKFELLIPYHANAKPDGLHELQLSPRALRPGVGAAGQPR